MVALSIIVLGIGVTLGSIMVKAGPDEKHPTAASEV
jgi:hypothetical protein